MTSIHLFLLFAVIDYAVKPLPWYILYLPLMLWFVAELYEFIKFVKRKNNEQKIENLKHKWAKDKFKRKREARLKK